MKKLFIINVIWIAAISCLHLSAQEVSVYGGGGLSTIHYQLSSPNPSFLFSGDRTGAFGGDFGVGFTHYLHKGKLTYGIHSGLELGFYKSKASIKNGTTLQESLIDTERNVFNLRTTISDYEETQKLRLLNIPVLGMLQIDRFYALVGVKFGIPVGRNYEWKGEILTNEAFYHAQEGDWLKAPKFMGYGDFTEWTSDEKINYNISTTLSLEAGAKWKLTDELTLYTGAYFDYGLNNSINSDYNKYINYTINDLNHVEFTTNSALSTFTQKANVMSAGIKVRLAMKL